MNCYEDLKDKKVLVTGSSSGIGAATAAMLAEAGAEVFVHASSFSCGSTSRL